MTEEQIKSPLIASSFLVLFATMAVASIPLFQTVTPGGNLYVSIATPLCLVVSSAVFGYQLYIKGHFLYLITALLIAGALGGSFCILTSRDV